MRNILNRAASVMGAPVDALGDTHIELLGSSELIVEGQKGLLLYSEEEIRLSLGMKVLSVRGKGLTLKAAAGDLISIGGAVSSIAFENI